MTKLFVVLFINYALINLARCQSPDITNLAFPPNWDGDKYQHEPCYVQGTIPDWLDGYYLIQTSGSYGKQSSPFGQKCTHLFDGIGAISSFEVANGQVKFSARYYPTRTYKIWDFYNRDMAQSTLAWMPFQSPYNDTSRLIWNNIPLYENPVDPMFQSHPNVDFWRIGQQIVGATEHVDIGESFNVATLTDFKHPSLIETNDIFRHTSPIITLTMAVHERKNQDDIIYAVNAAFDPMKQKMYQIVAKIMPDGTRTMEGMFETGTYDISKCAPDGKYNGDKSQLANYMHSITSTKKYVILPLTSIVYNPCLMGVGANVTLDLTSNLPAGVKRSYQPVVFQTDVPMKFLIFDKQSKTFVTDKPIVVDMAKTPIHQFNAYEDTDGTLVADMATADGVNGQIYDLLTLDRILHGVGKTMRLERYRINLQTKSVKYENVLADQGQELYDGEFPQINQKFMEQKYKYGYVMTGFVRPGAKISKIDMDARKIVAEFAAPGNRAQWSIFREPWFVPRPGSTVEDDGVVMVLGGDANSKLSTLYVVDAKNMALLGQAEVPTFIPLGLHNRFFFKTELGMNPTPKSPNNGNGNQPPPPPPPPEQGGLTWGSLLESSKQVFCKLFKEILDKTEANFCANLPK